MRLGNQLQTVLRAAVFATIAIGGMGAGLGITTFTVEKANDYMFAEVAAKSGSADHKVLCPME